jgi:hypothetical protein
VASPPDTRFGVVEAYHAPGAASWAGAAWERVRFHWAEIQAGGEASWDDGEFTDEVLAAELAAGRQVIGLLIGLPDWAGENGIPRGLYLPHTDPGNTWAAFVRTVVGRYAGRIHHWILWNEPDVWDASHPGHTWGGSVQDFLQLTRVGYVTAKEANRNAVIHLAAVTHWWDAAYGRPLYFRRFLDALAADPNAVGSNHYFDVATLHLYFQPHHVYELTSHYYGLMAAYGIRKPIWIVETNAAPSEDPLWPVADPRFRVSLEEQAAYIPQALAMGMAAGAERIGVYKLIDTPGDAAANPEPFGLVRGDGSYRPAFFTFQVAASMLAGATSATRERWDDIGWVTVEQERGTTTVLFSRVPGPRLVQVPTSYTAGTLVDMWGNGRPITADGGVFNIELPAAPCGQAIGDYCMIGGPTVYLVQGTASGNWFVEPPPVEVASPTRPTAAPVAEASPARTAIPEAPPTATAAPTPTVGAIPTPSSTLVASPRPATRRVPDLGHQPSSTSLSPLPSPPPCTSVGPVATVAPRSPALDYTHKMVVAAAIALGAGLVGLRLWFKRR